MAFTQRAMDFAQCGSLEITLISEGRQGTLCALDCCVDWRISQHNSLADKTRNCIPHVHREDHCLEESNQLSFNKLSVPVKYRSVVQTLPKCIVEAEINFCSCSEAAGIHSNRIECAEEAHPIGNHKNAFIEELASLRLLSLLRGKWIISKLHDFLYDSE